MDGILYGHIIHSLYPTYFAELASCVDDGMLFVKPSGTAIPLGSKLLEARILMKQRQDLRKVVLSGKRVFGYGWLIPRPQNAIFLTAAWLS